MTLEEWGPLKPWESGVGGSETGHLECAMRLAKRGYQVISYSPLPGGWHDSDFKGVRWYDVRKMDPLPKEPAIILNYRSPKLFDVPKNPKHKYWFISQDVDYEGQWTEQGLANTDRFLALCQTHADYTLDKYPHLLVNNKVFISSNGIRTDYIEKLPPLERQPYRMFWASSPDRGLLLLLENWFRIRERFPKAELRIAYGFNNMDTIINWQGPNSKLIELRQALQQWSNQEGLTWLGRLPQDQVFKEWQQASVFPACSDWPETSGISYMEAMACGAIPVTTNFWAQGEHASAAPLAYVSDSLPQKSELAKSMWLNNLYEALELTEKELSYPPSRHALELWARKRYDWERILDQWEGWLKTDMSPKVDVKPIKIRKSGRKGKK